MKLNIKDIGPLGRDVAWDLGTGDLLEMLAAVGVDCQPEGAEAHLRLHLAVTGSEVLGRGTFMGQFDVSCGRCLRPARVEVPQGPVTVTFVPRPAGQGAAAAQWKLEDVDSFSFDGEEIDLEPLVRESLVLAIPIAPLCRAECRGLCSGCGADLNVERCHCHDAAGQAATPSVARGEGK